MDTSDFYDTAVLALKVLDRTIPTGTAIEINEHYDATHALRDFIRAADMERENNAAQGHEHDRKEWRDGL